MSHFCVAVATKTKNIKEIERILNPYYEGLEVEPYKDEDGEETTYNPNSKWDWYEIGGRYNNTIIVDKNNKDVYAKGGWGLGANLETSVENYSELKRVNGAKIKDIKFDLMGGSYEEALREWELLVEKQEPKNEEEREIVKWNFYKPEYYIKRYGTKEEYARLNSMWYTWAFVNEEGWAEQGEMGFWAMNNADKNSISAFVEKLNEYLKSPEHQEEYLFIVDCHI